MNKIKVVAYCRTATNDQLASQTEHFNDYINKNPEIELVEIYHDYKSSKKRDAIDRMISDAENGGIDLILTMRTSCFSRNVLNYLSIIDRLSKSGVGVIFTHENIDIREQNNVIRLTALFNQYFMQMQPGKR
jgi:DNA invertase Pin-like site-specific DNA recombinase